MSIKKQKAASRAIKQKDVAATARTSVGYKILFIVNVNLVSKQMLSRSRA